MHDLLITGGLVIGRGSRADLVIGCDPIVAASAYTLTVMQPGRTFVALNTHGTPTAATRA